MGGFQYFDTLVARQLCMTVGTVAQCCLAHTILDALGQNLQDWTAFAMKVLGAALSACFGATLGTVFGTTFVATFGAFFGAALALP